MVLSEPTRVIVVMDQPVFAETVAMPLNHGVYHVRVASTVPSATTIITAWRPQLDVVDMDLGGTQLLTQLGLADPGGRTTGDLKTKTRIKG